MRNLLFCEPGLRAESERPEGGVALGDRGAELNCRFFSFPAPQKNEQDHVCVLNSVARSIVDVARKAPDRGSLLARPLPASTIRVAQRAGAPWPSTKAVGRAATRGIQTYTCTICGTVGRRLRAEE